MSLRTQTPRGRETHRGACDDAAIAAAGDRQPPALDGRGIARGWNAVLVVVVGAALIAQVVLIVHGGSDANSAQPHVHVPLAWRLLRFVSYFTVQSNILVLAAATTLVLDPDRDGRWWRVLRLDGLLGILVTGVVFSVVLAPIVNPTGLAYWLNLAFHYFSPIWALLGWLVFGPRPRITNETIAGAFVWPVAWIVYTFVHGAISHWYPYPFLDAGLHGYGVAIRNTCLVVVVGGIVLYAFKLLDRLPVLGGRSQ
jgi:hypothetical protein